MSKVLILQENPRINYNKASEFGDLRFVTNKEYTGNKSSITDPQIVDDLKKEVDNFDLDNDFILLSGNPILIGLAVCSLSSRLVRDGEVDGLHFLHYNKNNDTYREVVVPLETILKLMR